MDRETLLAEIRRLYLLPTTGQRPDESVFQHTARVRRELRAVEQAVAESTDPDVLALWAEAQTQLETPTEDD